MDQKRLVVAIDADISDVFTTPEAINKALRALIEAMPTTSRQKATSQNRHNRVK